MRECNNAACACDGSCYKKEEIKKFLENVQRQAQSTPNFDKPYPGDYEQFSIENTIKRLF